MFIEKIIEASRKELKDECDYIKEAKNQENMRIIIEQ
jgi:predicted unusual protein kinase regulating ubiquinone biosynthesis (AarF/ABC1/UbiB family)